MLQIPICFESRPLETKCAHGGNSNVSQIPKRIERFGAAGPEQAVHGWGNSMDLYCAAHCLHLLATQLRFQLFGGAVDPTATQAPAFQQTGRDFVLERRSGTNHSATKHQ